MIRRFLLLSVLSLPLMARAYNVPMTDTIRWEILPQWEELLQPLEPAYLENAVEVSPWRGNWFVDVSGGVSAFVGSPLGCGDIFDRMKPALSVSVGKWFTPAIGTRIVFQGLQFKDALLESRDFQHLHADLMWNVMPGISRTKEDFRWDLAPYVGLGILHNDELGRHPFAVSYGVQGRYRLTDRLHLTAELGCATTFKDFDGIGAGNKWGDRLLSLTAGFSYTIGKKGWKRVVDAAPYIERNERLTGYARSLRNENDRLWQKNSNITRIIAELEKILKLEGLLDKYAGRFSSMKDEVEGKGLSIGYPKNNYSGLNSLRARLRDAQANKDKHKGERPLLSTARTPFIWHTVWIPLIVVAVHSKAMIPLLHPFLWTADISARPSIFSSCWTPTGLPTLRSWSTWTVSPGLPRSTGCASKSPVRQTVQPATTPSTMACRKGVPHI